MTPLMKHAVESCGDNVDVMIIERDNCYFGQVEPSVPPTSKSNVRHLSMVPSAEPITLSVGIMAKGATAPYHEWC